MFETKEVQRTSISFQSRIDGIYLKDLLLALLSVIEVDFCSIPLILLSYRDSSGEYILRSVFQIEKQK
jgi:hypothetical protein